jgi:hypothetical protein
MINLDFFKWLKDEYGMQLDIYAFDAGAIDGAGYYGNVNSQKFKTQFPTGFGPVANKAKSLGTRLGIWGGPDGFGNTALEEKARIELMVSLCKDYQFELFKFDAVCGDLRTEKQDVFAKMMTECRKYSPNLILLNHRLNLGKALPHASTFLWEGVETYIDVHIANPKTATHHRLGALSRGLPPNLSRLTEDHGVCLSSCLDYWDDELILQAFNRSLILAPELYGNPWLLRDDEFPKLARIYNLHKRNDKILTTGMLLPEATYGPNAVSRGDEKTRFITLKNLSWLPVKYKVKLDQTIGLSSADKVFFYQYHPTENFIGEFKPGSEVEVEVLPFRSCLLMASAKPTEEISVKGANYAVIKDVEGKPAVVDVYGMPGSTASVTLNAGNRKFSKASLDSNPTNDLLRGKTMKVKFDGKPLMKPWHRKLADLKPIDVPADAEAMYEAACFATDNNALEVRSLQRSGDTKVTQVKNARDAFFNQNIFIERGLWDKNLFDGDENTGFYVCRRFEEHQVKINGGGLRIDFGQSINIDKLVIKVGSEHALQPLKSEENIVTEVSTDLKSWVKIPMLAGKTITSDFNLGYPVRYLRTQATPDRINEIEGYYKGKSVTSKDWKVSNLFSTYWKVRPEKAWGANFKLDEIANGSYLALAVNGEHGKEGAYAAIRVNGQIVGAADRSPSYPSNAWEVPVKASKENYTYYFPLKSDMIGKQIDVVILGLNNEIKELSPEVYITANPIPFAKKQIVLE